MVASVPAFLRPSSVLDALGANLSAEPKLIFVYLLLLVVPWVLWQGYRTGAPDAPDGERGKEGGDTPQAGGEPRISREDRKRLARKKRPGQIDWIQ